MKQNFSKIGILGALSAMAGQLLGVDYARGRLRTRTHTLTERINYAIGSYAPRQASPISPSRRFRTKDEANQLKALAALKRERKAVKRHSQYVSTFRGVMRDIENGWITPLLNNGDFSDLENHANFAPANVGASLLSVWQLRAYNVVTKFFRRAENFRITKGAKYRTDSMESPEVNHA